jgi:CDP-diacylglycerol---serine O-phosphatidyltransferase
MVHLTRTHGPFCYSLVTSVDVDHQHNSDKRRRKVFAVLPTLLTLGNAVCGFAAITILAQVGPSLTPYEQAIVATEKSAVVDEFTQSPTEEEQLFSARMKYFSERMVLASNLIFLAMLFDVLDGSAARLTNQTSEFGAQLDSLCDVISFGVAPAFLMLKLTHPNNRLMNSVVEAPFQFEHWPRFLLAFATLYVLCTVLRLARFNTETDEDDSHEGFSGLPSPAAAGVIASMPIGIMGLNNLLAKDSFRWSEIVENSVLPALAVLLPFITLAIASLMVSRVPYPHLFNQIIRGTRGRRQIVNIVFVAVLVFTVHEVALPVVFCWFALGAPIKSGWAKYVRPIYSGQAAEETVSTL